MLGFIELIFIVCNINVKMEEQYDWRPWGHEDGHPVVVVGVEDDLEVLLISSYKLVVFDHCHWNLNIAWLEVYISEYFIEYKYFCILIAMQ
jgi:hypothetical protein